jgi:excisionase family DNA binding protein
MNEEQQLLKPSDLAPMFGISVSRVYQMISAGELPSVRVGGAIRIPRGAWNKWLADQGDRAMKSLRSEGHA